MVDIQSKEVIDKISDELKVQPALQIPRELAKQIQLVYEVNPLRIANIVRSATIINTTSTIFTIPTRRDFFLTAVFIGSTSTVNRHITVIIDGAAQEMFETNNSGTTVNMPLSIPIKLDRGTNITGTSGGAANAFFTIIGYTTDPQ